MGTWTTNNGNVHNVNIEYSNLLAMKAQGARFCWFQDNPGINDEKNNTYYEDSKDEVDDETRRTLRQGITVVCEDGETLTGYVTNYVEGPAAATNISNWFIFQPGTYPTTYTRNNVYIEEL